MLLVKDDLIRCKGVIARDPAHINAHLFGTVAADAIRILVLHGGNHRLKEALAIVGRPKTDDSNNTGHLICYLNR